MRLHKLVAVLGLCALTSAALVNAQLGPNLIVNGSFEEPEGDNRWGINPATWFAGQTIPGWSVTQGSIDIKRSGTLPIAENNAYEGVQWIDLNGSPGVGGIAQDFTITTSGLYRLQFAMSANTGLYPEIVRTMRVSLTSGSTTVYTDIFSWDIQNHPNHQGTGVPNGQSWDAYSIDILLPAGSYTLSFVSLTQDPASSYGPFLDDVQLRLVPEPASLLALGAGLAGLLGLKRRNKR